MNLNIWQDIWNIYFAEIGLDLAHFLAYFIAGSIGAVASFAKDVRRSIRDDRDTPDKFSAWFMIRDNFFRGISIVALIAVIVINPEMFGFDKVTITSMIAIGYTLDNVVGGSAIKHLKNTKQGKKMREVLVNKYK